MGRLMQWLDRDTTDDSNIDDDTIDKIIAYGWRLIVAFWLGAIYFMDIIVLDIHWTKAVFASLVVIACYATAIGIWTIRKIAILLTVYACGYLVGALPAVTAIGGYLKRALS